MSETNNGALSTRPTIRRALVIGALVAASFGLAACSGSGASHKSGTTPISGASAPLNHMLPDAIRSKGEISVASLPDLPPWSFQKDGKWTGVDIDLTNALSKQLGVGFKYENIAFDGQMPGLAAKRFNVIIDELGDTVEREKAISFVTYTTEATGILVKSGNPKNIKTFADLCGTKVAVIPGSEQLKLLTAQSKTCTASGKAPVTQITAPTSAQTYLAVQSGRADSTVVAYSTGAYAKETGGKAMAGLEMAPGEPGQPIVVGMGFAKSDVQLGEALQSALNALIANGEYAAIMKKWDLTALMVDHSEINNAAAFNASHPNHQ